MRRTLGLSLLALGLALILAACGGAPPPDLSLAGVSPQSPTVAQGQSLTLTLTLASQNGFNGQVSLSVTEGGGSPPWLTLSPTTAQVEVPKGGQRQVSLQVGVRQDAPIGPHTLKLRVAYGNRTAEGDLTLTVTPPPDFTLGLNPNTLTVEQGNNGTTQLTVTPQNGFTGTVNLALVDGSGNPVSGITLSPTSVNVTGSNPVQLNLTVNVASSVAPNTYNLTLKATSGSITKTVPLTLTVAPTSSSEIFALLYEGSGTKALAMTSDSEYLYVAGYRQGSGTDGLQDALVWKLNGQGQVVVKKRIGSELTPGWSSNYTPVNDRAYALALDGDYLYVAGYLAGCDDSGQDLCTGHPFVAKLQKDNLEFVPDFGGNDGTFNQPGLAVLNWLTYYEPSYAYSLAVDESYLYVGGFGKVSSSAGKGLVAVLDKNTGQEVRRLVLGGGQNGSMTHVEAVLLGNEEVAIAFGSTLYVAGHTTVPFDCTGNPTGPVQPRPFAFFIRINIGDLLSGNLCSPSTDITITMYNNQAPPVPEELLSLAMTEGWPTRFVGAGFCTLGPLNVGGNTAYATGQACLLKLSVDQGAVMSHTATYENYPDPGLVNCPQRTEGSDRYYDCADRVRSVRFTADGKVLVTGHIGGSQQASDRFPGTEDGLSGSDLFFALYEPEPYFNQLTYIRRDYGGGTDLGFAVVQGPGGYYYVAGATTGPLGNLTNSNPKAIVLRFGP